MIGEEEIESLFIKIVRLFLAARANESAAMRGLWIQVLIGERDTLRALTPKMMQALVERARSLTLSKGAHD